MAWRREFTHIRRSILIILARLHSIWLAVTKQQRAPVPSSSEARDDNIHLGVTPGGERPGRVTKDVAGRRSAEADAVGEREGVVANLAGDVAEGGLGVDCELLGGVLGEDCDGVSNILMTAKCRNGKPWLM